jgi:predicted dehydrogenase
MNVAVIGCGYWAPNVVRNISRLKSVKVSALCDKEPKRMKDLADRMAPGARLVSDYKQILQDSQIDAVLIVTPIRSHFQIAKEALLAKKHVFIEKPLTATTQEAEELTQLADAQQVTLMVGHVFEFNPTVLWIKDYLDKGELGQLLYVYSQRLNLGRIQNDINAMWSFAPHDISILNFWLNAMPVSVSARGLKCLRQGVEDVVFVVLEYPGGIGVHLHLGWLDPRRIRQMTLVGSKKMLVYDDVSIDNRIQIYDKGINQFHEFITAPDSFAEFQYELRGGDAMIPHIKFVEPLQEEMKHFVDCITQRKKPKTDGQNGLNVVRVLEAAQKSLDQDGIKVEIKQASQILK